ncbi:MAG TPA: hypothetical protein VFA97_01975 [Gaiellaceae bacterium]|nr:hypothetical protein [Gaiellaceae bacterium]
MSIATVVGAVALAAAPTHALLSVSPAHVDLVPGARRVVAIDTGSTQGLAVAARVAGLTLDARGRPRLVRPGDASPWLRLSSQTLRAVHGHAQLAISVRRVPPHTAAGDHTAVVLLTATQPGSRGVLVRMRVGLVVSVRVPGKVVHRLALGARVTVLRKRRTIELVLANRGNVTEHVDGSRLSVLLARGGRTIAVLRPQRREFLPRSQGLVLFGYAPQLRGVFTVRVGLWQSTVLTVRRFRLRL